MNLNKQQRKKGKTIPNELLVDIFKAVNIPPNELELNILEEESTTKIFKQLKKYSKNLLVSSRILTIIVGEVFKKRKIAAILILTLEKKKHILIRQHFDDLTERVAQLEELNEERVDQIVRFHDIEANLNELEIVKKKISKIKYLLLAVFIVCLFLLCLFVWIL
uniref:Uncharacterized protein n=1 Tax=Meloidogyne enterolobii TaxID=390850 RepID=A0A6V7XFW5_MELEN|nr:unnamed protein product [Meloidogyne enterolobii]